MRHLHRDYTTSHCGQDISHLLATFDENQADCPDCIAALAVFRAEQAAALAAAEQEMALAAERLAQSIKAPQT